MPSRSRRQFLVSSAQAACAAAALPAVAPLLGCPTGVGSETPDDDGWLTLALGEYPALAGVGGMISVAVEGMDLTLAIARVADEQFAAIDGTCSHAQCTLDGYDGAAEEFTCPCHGSRFATDGDVSGGPATVDLEAFETEYDSEGGTVRVRVGG